MNSSTTPELNPADQIQFIADHRVRLDAGDYSIDVAQQVTIKSVATHWFKHTGQKFSILGERFTLPPQLIHAAFPPPGSRGNFWRDLPHVILERSTLPWERSANETVDASIAPPWLALLLFHQEDPIPRLQPVKLGDLNKEPTKAPFFPALANEVGQHDDDQLMVIEVPRTLLSSLLGSAFSFEYQTHARQRLAFFPVPADQVSTINQCAAELPSEAAGKSISECPQIRAAFAAVGASLSDHATITRNPKDAARWSIRDLPNRQDYEIWKPAQPAADKRQFDLYRVAHEKAVVLANRLPMPGARNAVHLVSLEGRFQGQVFNYQNAGGDELIRLVSLYRWEFFCEDTEKDFQGLLEGLNHLRGADSKGGTVVQDKETAATFCLPIPELAKGDEAEKFLRAGFVPLVHRFREGSRSVSWYHGPFVPDELSSTSMDQTARQVTAPGVTLPASASDQLVIYDTAHGMFDVSYAAAWELGRMLTLRNTRVATSLYHWKRDHVHSLHADRHLAEYGFELPVDPGRTESDRKLPGAVTKWLDDLTLLRGVPFNYLVPDPRLLPIESLRFFTIDRIWLECLRDGAFSIGRVLAADADRDRDAMAPGSAPAIPTLSGFLLRSEVVSGFWPSLRIQAYSRSVPVKDAPGKKDRETSNLSTQLSETYPALSPLRVERLAPNVMIALFVDKQKDKTYGAGKVQMVDFHLKPEMMHFGFHQAEADKLPAHFDPALADFYLGLEKRFRDPSTGEELPAKLTSETIAGCLSHEKRLVKRLVKIGKLADAIKEKLGGGEMDSALFALQMIAGVELVRFCRR